MKKYLIYLLFTIALVGSIFTNNEQELNDEQIQQIQKDFFQIVWSHAMEAKDATNTLMPNIREELLENLCSSAPNVYFVTHADLSDSLSQANNTSASIFVSTDNQNSWIQNDNVAPINQPGYENTWGATTTTNGGDNVDWYLQGSIDSESLGLDFGQITVSQSPHNVNNVWPPSDNLYATLVSDDIGDNLGGGSGQDIVNLRATYYAGDTTITSDDKLYASMGLNGSCCDEGGFFGPWNLYSIAIVNPDAENPVAYSYAYGNGGFGQLYPAIYKIDGDLTTGEVGGFEVLSENFDYSTAGNNLQATSLLDIIVNDSDWGAWPNSLNGLVLVGVSVSAGLDGLDIAIDLLDTSNPGVLVMSSQTQYGNTPPTLSEPNYNSETGELSVIYTDYDNNLATMHDVFIDDMAFIMAPDSHTYSEGVQFSANIGGSGGGTAQLYFSDGGGDPIMLEVDLGGSGGGCQFLGDSNTDGLINVLDVVLTVNLILCEDCPFNECSDINSDSLINVLDVVSLVNIILGVR